MKNESDQPDWGALKGIADEEHWVQFVPRVGGGLVAPHIKRQGVKNADFIFTDARIILELKVIMTELAHSKEMLAKVDALSQRTPLGLSDPSIEKAIFSLLRVPLKRILKTANRQIRETKQELGLVGWQGLIVVVNDGFTGAPPDLILTLLNDIMASESYSSCDGLVYQTNHLVELVDSPYANWLWVPMYNPRKTNEFVAFVNHLGREWRTFHEEISGPFESSAEYEYVNLTDSHVVRGSTRHKPYVPPEDTST